MTSLKNNPFFCSWSGGKDSALALHHAIKAEGKPKFLLTMMMENGERSKSHGLSLEIIQAQASSLEIPLINRATSWNDYENLFISELHKIKQKGIDIGVFGDIDLDEHREWVVRVCSAANIIAHHPLWKKPRLELLYDFLDTGFKSTIISIKDSVLDKRFLGMTLDRNIIREFEDIGIDASGEKGEYHTVVTEGPIFSFPLKFDLKGKVFRDGYWFLDVAIPNLV